MLVLVFGRAVHRHPPLSTCDHRHQHSPRHQLPCFSFSLTLSTHALPRAVVFLVVFMPIATLSTPPTTPTHSLSHCNLQLLSIDLWLPLHLTPLFICSLCSPYLPFSYRQLYFHRRAFTTTPNVQTHTAFTRCFPAKPRPHHLTSPPRRLIQQKVTHYAFIMKIRGRHHSRRLLMASQH